MVYTVPPIPHLVYRMPSHPVCNIQYWTSFLAYRSKRCYKEGEGGILYIPIFIYLYLYITPMGRAGRGRRVTHSLFLHLNPFYKKRVGENNFFFYKHSTNLLFLYFTYKQPWRHWWRHYLLMTSLVSNPHFIPTTSPLKFAFLTYTFNDRNVIIAWKQKIRLTNGCLQI